MATQELILVGRRGTQNLALHAVLEQTLQGIFDQVSLYDRQRHIPCTGHLYLIDAQLLDDSSINCLIEMIEQQGPQTRMALFNVSREFMPPRISCMQLHGIFFVDDDLQVLFRGLQSIQKQERWIPETFFGEIQEKKKPAKSIIGSLTNREIQILLLIADSRSNQEIASLLHISNHTVKTHIYNLYKKIGVKTRMKAAKWAARNLNQPAISPSATNPSTNS